MTEVETMRDRVDRILARMAAACDRAGRARNSVQLMAVSKTRPPEDVEEAARCGLSLFGENRVREAAAKIPLCSSRMAWHLIGHLQGNKARMAVQLFEAIHSVDSPGLLERIDRVAGEEGKRPAILLEVNVSGEASKFGLAPDAVSEVARIASRMPNVTLRGLMTIPPLSTDPEQTRAYFRALRELRDRIQNAIGQPLPELSMGMSGDFEIAIEEGATVVRIGTDLFGPRTVVKAEGEE